MKIVKQLRKEQRYKAVTFDLTGTRYNTNDLEDDTESADDDNCQDDCHMDIIQIFENDDVTEFTTKHSIEAPPGGFAKYRWIHIAAYMGALKILHYLVEEDKAKVDEEDDLGRNALYWAVSGGHVTCIEHLLRHGAVLRNIGKHGEEPLCVALRQNHLDLLDILLELGGPVDGNDVFNPLIEAVNLENRAAVQLLLRRKAQIENRTSVGVFSQLAPRPWNSNRKAIVADLLEHAEFSESFLKMEIYSVVLSDNYEMLTLMLEKVAKYVDLIPIANICFNRRIALGAVDAFLNAGLSINASLRLYKYETRCSLLHCATKQRNTKLVSYLLQRGFDVRGQAANGVLNGTISLSAPSFSRFNRKDQEWFHKAKYDACLEMLTSLLEAGIDVDNYDNEKPRVDDSECVSNALCTAVRNGCARVALMLLRHGATVSPSLPTQSQPLVAGFKGQQNQTQKSVAHCYYRVNNILIALMPNVSASLLTSLHKYFNEDQFERLRKEYPALLGNEDSVLTEPSSLKVWCR